MTAVPRTNEPFDVSLERSVDAEKMMVRMIRARGERFCSRISRDPDTPDQGDILTWKVDPKKDHKYWFQTLDVKQALEWEGPTPPMVWQGLYLCKQGAFHPDWKYVIFNAELDRCAWVDAAKVYQGSLTPEPTKNRRQGDQISLKLPFDKYKFMDVTI